MATARKANSAAASETLTKKAAPRRKPAATATDKPATSASAPKARRAAPKAKLAAAEVMPEEIERLAYQLWEERGRPEGTSIEDWNRAQAILAHPR